MTTEAVDTDSNPSNPQRRPPERTTMFLDSPAVKLVLTGIMTMVLIVPSYFVWLLVEERAGRANEVAGQIADSWGGTQAINGPYLVVPFSETFTKGTGKDTETETRWRTVVLFPQELDITGDIGVEERSISIYSLPVYRGQIALKGQFSAPPDGMFEPLNGGTIDIAADKAVLVVGIDDVRALRSEVVLQLNGSRKIPFEPGLGPLGPSNARRAGQVFDRSGINAGIPPVNWRQGFSFDIALQLNGSSAIYAAPAGQTSKIALKSDWPHPGFTGAFLPESRTITEAGFEAEWTIPYLARGIPKMLETGTLPLGDKLLGVKFVEPVDFYQTIARSLKYAIGFISLTMLAVFVLEMRSPWRFHWIQYGWSGWRW